MDKIDRLDQICKKPNLLAWGNWSCTTNKFRVYFAPGLVIFWSVSTLKAIPILSIMLHSWLLELHKSHVNAIICFIGNIQFNKMQLCCFVHKLIVFHSRTALSKNTFPKRILQFSKGFFDSFEQFDILDEWQEFFENWIAFQSGHLFVRRMIENKASIILFVSW